MHTHDTVFFRVAESEPAAVEEQIPPIPQSQILQTQRYARERGLIHRHRLNRTERKSRFVIINVPGKNPNSFYFTFINL